MKHIMKAWELMEKLRGKGPAAGDKARDVMEGVYSGDKDKRFGKGFSGMGGKIETLADDGPLAAGARDALGRDEALVREVLRLVDVDYDALIAMDGKSPYSLAVAANPAVVDDILKDASPVVAAMKVALGYKPVAEFTQKYGSAPDEVKAKIKAEVLAEMQGAPADAVPVVKRGVGPLFSGKTGRGGVEKAVGKGDLASLFK
ncbi:MAG: hypothetical protein WAZ18_06475, partial [Alphaproteobacteria bacterium]